MSSVSHHAGVTSFLAVILNLPKNNIAEEGRLDHVIRIFRNVPARPQRFKSPSREADIGPSQGHSRISPTHLWVYKEEAEAVVAEQFSVLTICPPPIQHWKNTSQGEISSEDNSLLEAALVSGMPPDLYLSFPCTGHYLPHSPLAASFKRFCLAGLLSTKPSVAIQGPVLPVSLVSMQKRPH